MRGKFKYTIDDMHRIAKERGGKCLSKKFLGVTEYLEWDCENSSHPPFPATPNSVINSGTWCRLCGEEKKGRELRPVRDVEEIVEERGGKIIRFVGGYVGMKSNAIIECADGHTWPVTVASLLYAKSWCPECNDPIGEHITRKIFEATYGVPFKKIRPAFLKTEKGGYLELDGYNADLRLAFEYQGPHHDKPAQIERDKAKMTLCSERGIKILEIPYVKNPWPPEKVFRRVKNEIQKVDPNREVILPNEDFYSQKLKELKDLARSRGGSLLSNVYQGGRTNLLWSCGNSDHLPWEATSESIRSGSWCPHCAPNAPVSMDDLRKFGKAVDLILVSENYRGPNKLYDWKCKNGHRIKRSKGNIIQSLNRGLNACTKCAGTFLQVTMADLLQIAIDREGECLSEEYINAHAELHWQCAYGHKFSRNWNKVQQGYWCKHKGCPHNRKFEK